MVNKVCAPRLEYNNTLFIQKGNAITNIYKYCLNVKMILRKINGIRQKEHSSRIASISTRTQIFQASNVYQRKVIFIHLQMEIITNQF